MTRSSGILRPLGSCRGESRYGQEKFRKGCEKVLEWSRHISVGGEKKSRGLRGKETGRKTKRKGSIWVLREV